MQKFAILSDQPLEEWQSDLARILEELSGYQVRGLALVALVEADSEDDDDVLAWYNRMSVRDKQLVAAVIEGDVHYAIARQAIEHYMEDREEEE